MAADSTLEDHLRSLDPRPLDADLATERFGGYVGYTELIRRLVRLSDAGARVESIGRSVEDNPLFAVVIGPDLAPNTTAMIAGIHPIEWIGVETLFAAVDRLVAEPPRDRRIIAFPVVNVDGYRAVEADLRAGRIRWRRGNANGVDLNRNWPTHFKHRRWLKTRLIAGYNNGGPHPLSEPEVAALVATLDRVARSSHIDVAVSLHCFGRMLLIPYGGRWRPPEATAMHRRAARVVQKRLKTRYRITPSSHWVPGAFAHGMELDHLHARYNATAILVECGRGGLSLRDPGSFLQPFRWFNPPVPERVSADLAAALEPFLRGEW